MTRSTILSRWCLYAQGAGAALVAIGFAVLAKGTADDIRTYGYPAFQGATVHGLVVRAISAGLLGVVFFVIGRQFRWGARWRRFALCFEGLVILAFCAAWPVWLASGDLPRLRSGSRALGSR